MPERAGGGADGGDFRSGFSQASRTPQEIRRPSSGALLVPPLLWFRRCASRARVWRRQEIGAMFAISLPTLFAIKSRIRSIVIEYSNAHRAGSPQLAGNENASAADAVAGEVANKQQMHRLFLIQRQTASRRHQSFRRCRGMMIRVARSPHFSRAERYRRQQTLFPESGQQWPELLHLSPTRGWLERQCTTHAGTFCRGSH